jgi:hypothetical protein
MDKALEDVVKQVGGLFHLFSLTNGLLCSFMT